MTNLELRGLYSHCIYCLLDYNVEKELSDWELREVFIPIINDMINDGYDTEQIKDFVLVCHSLYYMSDITFIALCDEYNLKDYPLIIGYVDWKDNGYFLKVKAMNKN